MGMSERIWKSYASQRLAGLSNVRVYDFREASYHLKLVTAGIGKAAYRGG